MVYSHELVINEHAEEAAHAYCPGLIINGNRKPVDGNLLARREHALIVTLLTLLVIETITIPSYRGEWG